MKFDYVDLIIDAYSFILRCLVRVQVTKGFPIMYFIIDSQLIEKQVTNKNLASKRYILLTDKEGVKRMVQLNVKTTGGRVVTIDVEIDQSIRECKQLLEELLDVPIDQQRLIFRGKVLNDTAKLLSYGIKEKETIYFVRGSTRSTKSSASSNEAQSAASSNTSSVPILNNESTSAPFGTAAMTGTSNLMGGFPMPPSSNGPSAANGSGMFGLPDMSSMQQNMLRNPEMMRQMMDSPLFQGLLDNPDVLRSTIQSNPAMQQLLEQNPQLNHIMNDPELMRQSMEAMRNPVAMREMMRNQDSALRNIESHPEGFNMLRRMYHDVQEPLLDAASTGVGAPRVPAFTMPGVTSTTPAAESAQSSLPSSGGSMRGSGFESQAANPWASGTGMLQNALNQDNSNASSPFGNDGGVPGTQPSENTQGMAQLLSNPMMQMAMSQFLNNPQQWIQQMEHTNPGLAAMLNANPQAQQMLQNPDMMRSMLNPQNMQAILQLQGALDQLQAGGVLPSTQVSGSNVGSSGLGLHTGTPNPFSLLSSLSAGSPGISNNPGSSNPDQLYASQLTQLSDMGFSDREQNIRALQATSGNVHAAVDRILSGLS
uniref:Ubiquitin family protein putative n=1 Tax=Albugo laibachii Nc14 TaxID=890382 RepID=F0W2V3_9STRA|nr:ubiquitin family protein putative [Albugo laibachii Nc14]|eukprot:CCA15389.1 ubiquitin family protein putative [Albugo laibachii Nc14]